MSRRDLSEHIARTVSEHHGARLIDAELERATEMRCARASLTATAV